MEIIHNGVSLRVNNPSIESQILNLCFGVFAQRPKVHKNKHIWSEQDLQILKDSLENKVPIAQIVEKLNGKFTKNAVNAQAYKCFPALIKAMTSGVPFGVRY